MADNDNIIPFKRRYPNERPTMSSVDKPARREGSIVDIDYSKLVNDTCFEMGNKYRFNVMRDGVPEDQKIAYDLTTRLRRALEPLAKEFGATALYNLMGVRVFFSREMTEYKKDPREPHALYLKNDFSEQDINRLIRPLLTSMTPSQRTANTSIYNLILGPQETRGSAPENLTVPILGRLAPLQNVQSMQRQLVGWLKKRNEQSPTLPSKLRSMS